MIKKLAVLVFTGYMLVNFCGCAAVAGVMAETQKVKQTINLPYGQALDAVKKAMQSKGIVFDKAVIDGDSAKVIGKTTSDKTVNIFIAKVNDNESSIAVRVGKSETGMAEASSILEAIVSSANADVPSPKVEEESVSLKTEEEKLLPQAEGVNLPAKGE